MDSPQRGRLNAASSTANFDDAIHDGESDLDNADQEQQELQQQQEQQQLEQRDLQQQRELLLCRASSVLYPESYVLLDPNREKNKSFFSGTTAAALTSATAGDERRETSSTRAQNDRTKSRARAALDEALAALRREAALLSSSSWNLQQLQQQPQQQERKELLKRQELGLVDQEMGPPQQKEPSAYVPGVVVDSNVFGSVVVQRMQHPPSRARLLQRKPAEAEAAERAATPAALRGLLPITLKEQNPQLEVLPRKEVLPLRDLQYTTLTANHPATAAGNLTDDLLLVLGEGSRAPAAAEIVHAVRQRFWQNKRCTSFGHLLLCLFSSNNTRSDGEQQLRQLESLFTEEKRWQYSTEELAALAAHPYKTLREAVQAAALKRNKQVILIFGENACGQLEVLKELSRFLCVSFSFSRTFSANVCSSPTDALISQAETWRQNEELFGCIERLDTAFSLMHGNCCFLTDGSFAINGDFSAEGELVRIAFVSLGLQTIDYSVETVASTAHEGLEKIFVLPPANIFYYLLYALAYERQKTPKVLQQSLLAPLDAAALLQRLPPHALEKYPDSLRVACAQFLEDLHSLNLNVQTVSAVIRVLTASLLADVAAEQLRKRGGLQKQHQTTQQERRSAAAQDGSAKAPQAQQQQPLLFAGRDLIALLAELLVVDEIQLREIYLKSLYCWEAANISLKLFNRLRFWVLTKSRAALANSMNERCSGSSPPVGSVFLLSARGFEGVSSHQNHRWSLLQFLRNFSEEILFSIFLQHSFSTQEQIYLREGLRGAPIEGRQSSAYSQQLLSLLGGGPFLASAGAAAAATLFEFSPEKGISSVLSSLNALFFGEFISLQRYAAGTAGALFVHALKNMATALGSSTCVQMLPKYSEAAKHLKDLPNFREGTAAAKARYVAPKEVLLSKKKPSGPPSQQQEGETSSTTAVGLVLPIVVRHTVRLQNQMPAVLSQFIVNHSTSEAVTYDATHFVACNAAPFHIPPELCFVLERTGLPLLRELLQQPTAEAAAAQAPISSGTLRSDSLLCMQSELGSLHCFSGPNTADQEETPEQASAAGLSDAHFIACVSNCVAADEQKRQTAAAASSSADQRSDQQQHPQQQTVAGLVRHYPKVERWVPWHMQQRQTAAAVVTCATTASQEVADPSLMTAPCLFWDSWLPAGERARKRKQQLQAQSAIATAQTFDFEHVWRQLDKLQILNFVYSQLKGFVIRLSFAEFVHLYSILYVPPLFQQQQNEQCQQPQQNEEEAFDAETKKTQVHLHAALALLQAFQFPDADFRVGKTLLFFRRQSFLALELQRMNYLQKVLPAVFRLQKSWRTFRARLFLSEARALAVRVQSCIRRRLAVAAAAMKKRIVDIFAGAVVVAALLVNFQTVGLTEEVMDSFQTRVIEREAYTVRWAAATVLQSFWRGFLARKVAGQRRQTLLITHASQIIQNVWRRFHAQATLAEKLELYIIPVHAATKLQAQIRRWIQQRRYQRMRGLALALMSIKRKGSKLYSLQTELNYKPIIKSTHVIRDMLQAHNEEAIVKVQSFLRMSYIRKQYLQLRDALHLCQAAARTRLRRYEFLKTKKSVIFLQRWWRMRRFLEEQDLPAAKPPVPRLPHALLPFISGREAAAVNLLREPLLAAQGFFFESAVQMSRFTEAHSFCQLVDFKLMADIRSIYPQTWAYPLKRLLQQLQIEAEQMKTNANQAVFERGPALQVGQVEVGGQHSLVLVHQHACVDSTRMALRMGTRSSSLSNEAFDFFPRVYAWGWNDRGQLGCTDTPFAIDGVACAGPLQFVDSQFNTFRDTRTGHLVRVLAREVNYTNSISWICAGFDFSFAVTSEGLVFSWGDNRMGQCGLGHRLTYVYSPQLICFLRDNKYPVVKGAVGPRNAIVVTIDGQCFVWGAHAFVGLDTIPPDSNFYSPTAVPLGDDVAATAVCCGLGFTVVQLRDFGKLCGFGRNDCGQLGLGKDIKRASVEPAYIALPPPCDFAQHNLFSAAPTTLDSKTQGLSAAPTPDADVTQHRLEGPSDFAQRLRVEKVAAGPDFVLVALTNLTGCMYTFGVHIVTDPQESTSGLLGKVAGFGAAALGRGEDGMNIFLRKQQQQRAATGGRSRAEAAAVQGQQKQQLRWTARRAVLQPTLVSHSLWKDRRILDIACGPRQMVALMDTRIVYGFRSFSVQWLEREDQSQQQQASAAAPSPAVYSAFFRKKEEPKVVESLQKKPTTSAQICKPLKGKYTLEPALFSFRSLRPARVTVKSVHCSYSNTACSTYWAVATRYSRKSAAEVLQRMQPAILKEQYTCTGDLLTVPLAVVQRAQQRFEPIEKEFFESARHPLPRKINYYPFRREALVEDASLDPRLVALLQGASDDENTASNSSSKGGLTKVLPASKGATPASSSKAT